MLFFLGMAVLGAIVLSASLLGADADGDGGTDDGPGWLNLKTVALFMVGSGAAGAIGSLYLENPWLTSLVGGGVGVGFAVAGYRFLKLVYGQQASSLVGLDDCLAHTAQVTVAIPPQGMGEVGLEVRGTRAHFQARAADGGAVEAGATVHVVDTDGQAVIVERRVTNPHEEKTR